MSFLHGALALGALAGLIPLIIHLLNRRKFKTVDWGAMHLLDPVVQKNHRRLQLEQLLLLLLRILIPVVLALLLARPVLTGVQRIFGEGKSSVAILLDDSLSMGAASPEGDTRFERAKAWAQGVTGAVKKGSDSSLLLSGGSPRSLIGFSTVDPEIYEGALEDADPAASSAELGNAIRRAAADLEEMENTAREIVVVSDFQATEWAGVASAARAIEEISETMDPPPMITLMPVGSSDGGLSSENSAVTGLSLSSLILAPGQRFALRADIHHFGDQPRRDVEATLFADGNPVGTRRFSVNPDGDAQVLFVHEFADPADHSLEVRITHDALASDDRAIAIAPVWFGLPVTIFDGEPSNRPMAAESSFLELALTPFGATGGGDGLIDLIRPRIEDGRNIDDGRYKEARVVVLANIAEIDDGRLNNLKKWVYDGGGALLVFAGGKCDRAWYREKGFAGGEGFLPAPYGDLRGTGELPAYLEAGRYEHPALALFNDPANGRPADAAFEKWFEIDVPATGSDVQVALRFADGSPFLVEKEYGRGRVMQCAAPADAEWGNWPTQAFYLPLIQRLVTHLAAGVEPPSNLTSGQPIRAVFPPEAAGRGVLVVPPEGENIVVEARDEGGRAIVEFDQTWKPGVYSLGPTKPEDAEAIPERRFAVSPPGGESDLGSVKPEELQEIAERLGATVAAGVPAYAEIDRSRRLGQEITRALLWALLIFLFLEILFQQWIARGRT